MERVYGLWISDFPYVNLSWREFIQNAWQFLAVEVPFLDFPKEIPVNSIFDSPSFSQNLREILQKRVPSPVSMVKRHVFFLHPKVSSSKLTLPEGPLPTAQVARS